MSKVKFGDWQKIIKAYTEEPSVVEFQVGEQEFVSVEVQPRISLTDRIALVNTVVNSCCPLPFDYEYDESTPASTVDAHRKPSIEYIEPVFRATVLQYYTNLDFSAKKADLETIWELAGNDKFYTRITKEIKDELWSLEEDIFNKLKAKMGNREELAGRVLNLLNRIETVIPRKAMEEFMEALANVDMKDMNVNDLVRLGLIGGDDAE